MGVGCIRTKAAVIPVWRRMWTGEFTCARTNQLISQVGPHFSREVGGKGKTVSFTNLWALQTMELFKHHRYQTCKMERYGSTFSWEHKSSMRDAWKKVAIKHRMEIRPRLRKRAAFLPAAQNVQAQWSSMPKPKINSLCHVPPNSELSSFLLAYALRPTQLQRTKRK